MNRFLLFLFAAFGTVYGAENLLAPNGKICLTMPPMGNHNAFSFLGEFGEKTVRGSGSYGVYINPANRIKFTGELLLQDLKYHFSDGTHDKWITQYAVGADYQYLFLYDFLQTFDLALSFSHAFHRGLSVDSPFSARVAGSDVVLSSAGGTFNLWECGYLSCALTYDFARYMRHYENQKVANGFGGLLHFIQYLPLGFSFDVETDFRRPYYYYAGNIGWHHEFSSFALDCGAYVNYTNGRSSVPNALVAGIQLSFSFGPTKGCQVDETDSFVKNCESVAFCDLASWAEKPAVYVPIVLAVADQADE